MAAPRHMPNLRRPMRVLSITLLLMLVAPSVAAAACAKLDQSRLASATKLLAPVEATPARADAAQVVSSARRRCSTALFAYAAARAARAHAAPVAGARMRVAGVDLQAQATPTGTAWRLDAVRSAMRLAAARSERGATQQRARSFPARAGGALVWSADPTRPSWDPMLQAAVANTLSRASLVSVRRDAGASVRAFAPPARRRAVARLPLLEQLTVTARLSVAARAARDAAADRTVRAIASTAYRGVARATGPGWSRIDGQWSTVARHRALVTRTRALLRRYPHAATSKVVNQLTRQLAAPADVRFRALPSGVFYPWPRDGAFDTQSMTVQVDKPGTLRIEIYDGGTGEAPIRVLEQPADPGDVVVTWDGAAADGTIQEAGEYVYAVVVDDIAGRQTRTPGLEPFRIARDTVAPVVRTATVNYLTSGTLGPRLGIAWDVDEPTSPIVRTQLVLSRNGKGVTLLLDTAATARVARRQIRLAAGEWTTTFVFTDGSGNVTSHPGRTLVVR